MTTMWGADAEALEALGKQMLLAADVLGTIQRSTRAGLHASPWAGGDADLFRSDWDRSHGPGLGQASLFLRETAERLAHNAVEQRTASSASPLSGIVLTVLERGWLGGLGGKGIGGLGQWRPPFPDGRLPFKLPGFNAFPGLLHDLDAKRVARELYDGEGLLGSVKDTVGTFRRGSIEGNAGNLGVIVSTTVHSGDLALAIRDGDMDKGIRAGIDVGFDIVGKKIPQVAAAKVAWDTGYAVGALTSKGIDAVFHTSQHHVDAVMQREYGTTNITPSQATALVHRYEGVTGFRNYVADSGKNIGSMVKGWFR